MADKEDRLTAVFEMLITRITDIEQRQLLGEQRERRMDEMLITRITDIEQRLLLGEQRERRMDEMRPAGSRLCGLIHCGRPVTIVKHFVGQPIGPEHDVIVVGNGIIDEPYNPTVYHDTRCAKLGAEVHKALLDAEEAAMMADDESYCYPMAADYGFADNGHEPLNDVMLEMCVTERFPAVRALGARELLLRGVEGGLGGALRLYEDVRAMIGNTESGPTTVYHVYTIGGGFRRLAELLIRDAKARTIANAVQGLTPRGRKMLVKECLDDNSFFHLHKDVLNWCLAGAWGGVS